MSPNDKTKVLTAEFENVGSSTKASFKVGKYKHSYFTRPWHYHPEFELLLITKGFGIRMIGDHFEKFEEGDLVLLGGNLPHAWISDPYFMREDNQETCESIYIQFKKNVFGTQFIDIPELKSIRIILKKAERGLKITGDGKGQISKQLVQIETQKPIEQLLTLIRLLDLIQQSEYEILSSESFVKKEVLFKSPKMAKAHNFIMQNFKLDINIDSCAKHVNLTPTSFCRLIKKHTNVTFSNYLNYIRIDFAQKLISKTDLPIKEIAYESGFTSVSYFNQVFKKSTGISPVEFRVKYS